MCKWLDEFFLAQEYKAEGYFGFVMRVDSGMKWIAERLLRYPGVMLALVPPRLPFISPVS
jgi:hypothetical protein